MSTPTTDIGEIFARIDNGLVTAREGRVLKDFVRDLVWKVAKSGSEAVELCRHCGLPRRDGHATWCVARQVA